MNRKILVFCLVSLLVSSPTYAATVDVASNFTELTELVRIFASLVGFTLFASAIYGFHTWSKTGGSHGSTPGKNATKALIGSVLVAVPWLYEMLKASLGVQTNATALTTSGGRMMLSIDANLAADVASMGQNGFLQYMPAGTLKAILAFVLFIGFVAFVSGVYTLKDIHEPSGGGRQAPVLAPMLKIVGGILCMNIIWFSCFVSDLLGIAMLCATN